MRLTWLALLVMGLIGRAEAQTGYIRVVNCGDWKPPTGSQQGSIDQNGNICTSASGGTASAVTTTPAQRTLVTLDVKTVTIGGTAVTALVAGNRTAGAWLQNPSTATVNLCINEIGTATGTTSSGDTTCIVPGQSYTVVPAAGAVSVLSSDSSHPFSGYGLK